MDPQPLNVALVYNQKKEDSNSQPDPDNSNDPPSPEADEESSSGFLSSLSPSLKHSTDTYAEWDTWETIHAVECALAEKHTVTLIEADDHAFELLRSLRPQIVFNIAEGLHGVSRESQVPAMLEFLQLPYTGSDPLTLALCLDKARAKEILSYHRLPTPRFTLISTFSEVSSLDFPLPAIVKPVHEGSSKGIFDSSLAHNREELVKAIHTVLEVYHEPALVEEFLPGREFTVALLGNADCLNVLPIVEINFETLPEGVNRIYSYEAKWIWDQAANPLQIFECPANLSDGLREEIGRLCRKAFTVMNCRDWTRIDVRLDSRGVPHIIELNPLPGILPNPEDNSCFPKAARAAGLSYQRLLQSVLNCAAVRYGLSHHSTLHNS